MGGQKWLLYDIFLTYEDVENLDVNVFSYGIDMSIVTNHAREEATEELDEILTSQKSFNSPEVHATSFSDEEKFLNSSR